MDWHQPWLLALDEEEIEQLVDDCRERAKRHQRVGHFGLFYAWSGLAHELVTRLLELDAQATARGDRAPRVDVVPLVDVPRRGAYGRWLGPVDGTDGSRC